MKTYSFRQSPIEVHGLPFFNTNKLLERVPENVRKAVPSLKFLGRRTPGARICFRTDAPVFKLKLTFETLSFDIGMSVYACQSANVLLGPRNEINFAGLLCPAYYDSKYCEKQFTKSAAMEDVTVFLPRNEVIADFEIEIDDGYSIAAPTPYRDCPPILYYGSSITEGGCAQFFLNSYNAIISNRLNVDYINYGFSGSARGELEMADLINSIPMSIFVMDYDYNAPNAEWLDETHERFFRRVREKNPNLPIIIMSAPGFDTLTNAAARRNIIKRTYENAVCAGDKNVWFIDGEKLFGETDRGLCSCDRVHPNDLGFYRMANTIEPLIKSILDERYPE